MKNQLTLFFFLTTSVLFSQVNNSKWTIGFNQSLDASYRTTKSIPELSWLKNQIDSSETWKMGNSSSIQITYDINPKFALALALAYDAWGEQLKSSALLDMKYYRTTYRYVGIPIGIQYSHDLKSGKLLFATGPEMLFSIGNIAHLQMNNSNSDSKLLLSKKENRTFVLGATARLAYQVNLDKSTQLQLGMLYKQQLTPVSTSDLQRKLFSIGLQLGILRHL